MNLLLQCLVWKESCKMLARLENEIDASIVSSVQYCSLKSLRPLDLSPIGFLTIMRQLSSQSLKKYRSLHYTVFVKNCSFTFSGHHGDTQGIQKEKLGYWVVTHVPQKKSYGQTPAQARLSAQKFFNKTCGYQMKVNS